MSLLRALAPPCRAIVIVRTGKLYVNRGEEEGRVVVVVEEEEVGTTMYDMYIWIYERVTQSRREYSECVMCQKTNDK